MLSDPITRSRTGWRLVASPTDNPEDPVVWARMRMKAIDALRRNDPGPLQTYCLFVREHRGEEVARQAARTIRQITGKVNKPGRR